MDQSEENTDRRDLSKQQQCAPTSNKTQIDSPSIKGPTSRSSSPLPMNRSSSKDFHDLNTSSSKSSHNTRRSSSTECSGRYSSMLQLLRDKVGPDQSGDIKGSQEQNHKVSEQQHISESNSHKSTEQDEQGATFTPTKDSSAIGRTGLRSKNNSGDPADQCVEQNASGKTGLHSKISRDPADQCFNQNASRKPGLHSKISRDPADQCVEQDASGKSVDRVDRLKEEDESSSKQNPVIVPLNEPCGDNGAGVNVNQQRRNIFAKLRMRSKRSLGNQDQGRDEHGKHKKAPKENPRVSKGEQVRRSSSRKSTGQIPHIVTSSSIDTPAVGLTGSKGRADDAQRGDKMKVKTEINAQQEFSLEILYPSDKHKTFGRVTTGYTVWCSYGDEQANRYSCWVPPAKLFDTTYKTAHEANDRARYLFFWENPFKVDPDKLTARFYVVGEKVRKNCKSFECKINGGTEAWKVGVVPSDVFEWLDHAEIHRRAFDDACGTPSSIGQALSLD